MAAAKRVLRYLCSTSGLGLMLGGRHPVVLTGHADASWADDQATQRSSQGYTFSLGSGSVSWRSTRSSSVLGSSCEAEIYAGAMAAQELCWLTYLLADLGEAPRSPPVLYVDNKAMLALCREHRLEHRTKHIALRYFLARELQQRGQLRLAYVASEANTADIFTKALPPGDHQRFCTMLDCVFQDNPAWRGEGRAMFMGADGRLVGLKRVLLVPGLCANLLSTKALSEAGMKMEIMGTKVSKTTQDGRVLWDLRGGKDMHWSMWEISMLPWKEAAACLAAEAVRGGHASHVTSGGGADGSDGGLLVHGGGAPPSVTPSTGETDWLNTHRRFGRVALPQLQQLFKEERVKGPRIKGEHKELTMAYTPQSNGVAERANRSIIAGGRTILVDSGLTLRFCPPAIRHATVIKNQVLTHVGGQHWVLMEKWSGKKPLVDMLRVFGCMGLVHVPEEKRKKLQAAAVWAVHLGLARGSNDWLMWDPKSNTIFTTRDAKFMEGLMFKEWSEQGRSKVIIPLGIEVEKNDPLLTPIELSSFSDLTEVSPNLGGAEGEAADVEGAHNPREVLLVQEEENEKEKGAEGEMEQICCFGINLPHESASMEEALTGDDREPWLASREDDFKSHMENETWTLTNLPPGRKALDCTWVLRVKTDAEGNLERRKTRLVIKGFQQREGIDFQEVFAPVAKAPTLWVLLASAAVCGWKVEQMDVKTAFLYDMVDQEIYMKQPEGYDDGSGCVCRINKAIYGLEQAPRCLYGRLVEALEALGFKVSGCDESLFTTEGEEEKVFLLVYVNDILLFSPSLERIKEVQGNLKETFQCKALGPVGYYLGLQVDEDEV
ncbi:unnamed protein product [Closterium sp. NIES-54]